jgi:hypothetical protein
MVLFVVGIGFRLKINGIYRGFRKAMPIGQLKFC